MISIWSRWRLRRRFRRSIPTPIWWAPVSACRWSRPAASCSKWPPAAKSAATATAVARTRCATPKTSNSISCAAISRSMPCFMNPTPANSSIMSERWSTWTTATSGRWAIRWIASTRTICGCCAQSASPPNSISILRRRPSMPSASWRRKSSCWRRNGCVRSLN
ncbi:hypothetical protein SDC9_180450 [bioreactor metagenome]|uniref:Uncharacterized protein n=1 Tax=bioreactor metagenome TaxID=1076179 RepID=A0A645H1R0_9ZZZZ